MTDPTVLPTEDEILWGEPFGGIKSTAFLSVCDFEDPVNEFLGAAKRWWNSSVSIYVATIWIQGGKPPVLKEFALFLQKYLIVAPIPAEIKSAGINTFMPVRFVLNQGPPPQRMIGPYLTQVQNAETDLWSLFVNVNVRYLETANAPS